jgi:hypothetical protein
VPTFTHGKDAVFKVDDSGGTLQDISNILSSVTLSREADTAEVSALGSSDKSYIVGLKDATISIEGMADVTTSGYLEGIFGGSAVDFEYYPAGTGSGEVKYSGTAILMSFETAAELGGAVSVSGEFQVTGGVTRATV